MKKNIVMILVVLLFSFSMCILKYKAKNYQENITQNVIKDTINIDDGIKLDEKEESIDKGIIEEKKDDKKETLMDNDKDTGEINTLPKPNIPLKEDSSNTIEKSNIENIAEIKKNYPSLNIKYDTKETTNPVVIYITTESGNKISYNNEDWITDTKKTIVNNVVDYSIKVKNEDGLVTEKKITINNIREKTIKEKNDELIKTIYDTYSVKVSYGHGTYCWYNGNSCVLLYDEELANTTLKMIYSTLGEFPIGFFKKFIGVNGYRIEMFDDIPGDVAGLASYEIGDDNIMFIDANTSFINRVFYHETWHIMEQYIYIMNNWNNAFNNWNSYNPRGYTYGDTGFSTYVTIVDRSSNISDISFISYYAKTNEREDRAELFADLMFRPYQKDYMKSGYGVNEKAKYLVSIIRQYWENSVNAKWERWITF